ncbi:MAG: hypothetical protein CSA60_01695 [Neptuniibacter caesariensis]|uniref:Methylated-DNA-[protein]-cysteine S-methyltransferase DNA binding domain-containing protein n=1 Tax=Neptuniibacter caesariensis TaxID=207954 RepID=A0A2G6JNX4_NEPCE|nr:MAG: hypothetical protein CSA60_01695 [Neptuniibacter caesariensis]
MARAVGRTLSRLPETTQLPWHRVINAQGKITFPDGSTSYHQQRERLEKEGISLTNGKVRLRDYQWCP